MKDNKQILVYCSSSGAVGQKYYKTAESLGNVLVKQKVRLMYGKYKNSNKFVQ